MEEFIFVGNDKESLLQKMYAISRLKRFKLTDCTNYGFRQNKEGKFFYMYNSSDEIICESVKFNKTGKPTYEELGYCEFTLNKEKQNLYIDYIEVFKEYQGQGIGNAIMDYVKALAKKHGLKSITLDRLQTFTDGKTTVTYYGDEYTEEDIKQLKQTSENVIDINEKFYKKQGFVKQPKRKPEFDHLVPMVLKKIVPAKPEITDCGKIFRCELTQQLSSENKAQPSSNLNSTNVTNEELLKKYRISQKRLI